MGNLLIYIFLLGILNSILFYEKTLGLSVILFIIPLLILIIYALVKNKKIKNKYGLLLTIPITILSGTYFIFDNAVFRVLNALIIPGLIILMYIITINNEYNLKRLFIDFFKLIFEPFGNFAKIFNLISLKFKGKHKLSDKTKQIIKALLIVIPITIIILIILSSADMIFGNIFKGFTTAINNFIENFKISDLIKRIFAIILFFFYISAVLNYLLFTYHNDELKEEKRIIKNDYTIKLLLTILNIIYILFDFIQIKSLMLHYVSESINYAEYARTGFFQLLVISIINITIILISKKFYNEKNQNYIKGMNILMILLTIIIIVSSFLRMNLYANEFGFTFLRLSVYVSLITEIFLLIPTIIYVFKNKFNVTRYYLIIIVIFYTTFNLINVDKIIAKNNINKFINTDKLDVEYLKNYHTDNIPELIDLYKKTDDIELKNKLIAYFNDIELGTNSLIDYDVNNFQEYNISKAKALREIKKLH